MSGRHHEKPLRRVNPSGTIRWVARFTRRDGTRASAGTYALQREAQAAIDAAYDEEYGDNPKPSRSETVGAYAETIWLRRHPRPYRTALAYRTRVRAALDVRLGRVPLRDWLLTDVRRRDVLDLLDVLLREHGRAASGAKSVLSTLSAMWEDAIADDRANLNPFHGVRVRSSDPRVQKPPRPIRIYTMEQMHALAAAAPGVYGEAMIRCLSDCGLRLGEMLPLERGDIDDGWLWIRRTAYKGVVEAGTKTTRGTTQAGRSVPLAPGLAGLLRALPSRLDTRLLFPSEHGTVFQERAFYADMWRPACRAAGLEGALAHELRHSYVSVLRAAGVNPADLARWTGHSVSTATKVYTHSTGASEQLARDFLAG